MSELIVRSPEHYKETLLHLIQNPLQLQKLRMRLWKSTLQSHKKIMNSHAFSRASTP
jgi:hypothetical protein